MPEAAVSESPVLTADIQKRFAERAAALNLKTPVLPFPSLCMDGKSFLNEHKEEKLWPTAADVPEARLKDVGKWWDHDGLLQFVDSEGKFYVARDVKENTDALKNAGFKYYTPATSKEPSNKEKSSFFTADNKQTLLNTIFNTPQDERERLYFAVRDGNLKEFEHALKHGAKTDKSPYFPGDGKPPVIFKAVDMPPSPERDEIIRRLIPESPIRTVGNDGTTILHAAFKSDHSVISILPDLIKTGANPLDRDSSGVPAFLVLDPRKDSGVAELKFVGDAMMKTEGLNNKERKLIQAHIELSDSHFRNRFQEIWSVANKFTANAGAARVPEQVYSFLEPLTDPKRAPKLLEILDNTGIDRLSNVDDLVNEFTAHVVLPQVLLDHSRQMGNPVTDKSLGELTEAHPQLMKQLTPIVKKELFKGRSIDKVIGLNQAWHDPQVVFPDALKPIEAAGEWHSLTGQKEHAIPELPGVTIHVLTTGNELGHEGKIMEHCVGKGGYATKGLKGESHIFSIRQEGAEKPLSTLEAAWDGKIFKVIQNQAQHNGTPPNEAKIAAAWLKDQMESRKIKASQQLGETTESKKINTRPDILRTVGFEINQDNINAAFAEYTQNDKRRAREYNPKSGKFDTISRRTELIAGSLNTDLQSGSFLILNKDGVAKKTTISYKDLPADIWFTESGLRQKAMIATLQPVIDQEIERRRVQQKATDVASVASLESTASEMQGVSPSAPPRGAVLKTAVQYQPASIETHTVTSALINRPAPAKGVSPTTSPTSISGQQGSYNAPKTRLAPVPQEISTPPAKLSLNGSASEWNPRMQGMNSKIGTAAIVINLADAALKKDPVKAVEVGGTALAMHAGMKVAGKVVGAEMVPVVGEVVGGIFAGKDAYDAAKSGHTTRAAISGIEATLYTVSATAGAATLADCWNPTVIAPAAVALVAGGAAVTITAAKGVYDNWNTVKGWFGHHEENHDAPASKPAPAAAALPNKPTKENIGALKTEMSKNTPPAKPSPAPQLPQNRNMAALKSNSAMAAPV